MRSRWVFYQSKPSHSEVLFFLLQRDPAIPLLNSAEGPLKSGPLPLGLRGITYDLPKSGKLLTMCPVNKITNKQKAKQNSKQKISLLQGKCVGEPTHEEY